MEPSVTESQAHAATVRTFEPPPDLASDVRVPPFNVPAAPEPHAGYNLSKRLIDIAGSAALLFLALLPLLAIAVAIKLTSRGPVLFRQRRLGLRGQEILLLKFRTMVEDAERRQYEVKYGNVTNGPTFKHPDDPRITPLGHFLRRWSLDELPQVWNVLRGEMSLVGPRALPVDQNKYLPGQDLRLSVKPGLTCIWQVSGRSTITFEHWMEMDLEYVSNRSLFFDLWLVLRTVPAVLSGRGAM
jgi:lipopolysaccharide/colanic/teichoic acid biosynthesis glycosyltransferase